MYAAGAHGIDCGDDVNDGGMAYGELDGRKRHAAAGEILPGADGVGDFRAGTTLLRQLWADVCGRAGRRECDFGGDVAGECDLSNGLADVWIGSGLDGELSGDLTTEDAEDTEESF